MLRRSLLIGGCAALGPSLSGRMADKGKLLLADDFMRPDTYTTEFQTVAPGWRVRAWQAEWKRSADGIESVWTKGHMPVLAYEGTFRDAVIELEFRFFKEAGKKACCRISATNPELNPRAYSVSAWANADSAERPLGMVLEHDEWKPGVITTVQNRPAQFDSGRWYAIRLEMVGDRAAASAAGVEVAGSHEKFGLPKTLIAIGTGYSPHQIRGLRVYEARPSA
jgi:hypothetical protein